VEELGFASSRPCFDLTDERLDRIVVAPLHEDRSCDGVGRLSRAAAVPLRDNETTCREWSVMGCVDEHPPASDPSFYGFVEIQTRREKVNLRNNVRKGVRPTNEAGLNALGHQFRCK
jgi:hypothetical protein